MLIRNIKMDRSYLHIPVKLSGARRTMQIWCGNALIREFYLAIAEDGDGVYFFLDLHSFQGCALTVVLPESEGLTDKALLGIRTGGDATPDNPLYSSLYREALRPQFHFSSRRGWLNDPWRVIIKVQRANTPKSDRIKRDKEGVLCEGMIRDSRKRQ